MLRVEIKSAKEPFEFIVTSTGEKISGLADFRDHTLTKANRIVAENGTKMVELIDKLEDDDEEGALAIAAEAVKPLLTLVLGDKVYKQLVKAVGGCAADSATQIMQVYVAIADEVTSRLGSTKQRKVDHYLQQDEAQ